MAHDQIEDQGIEGAAEPARSGGGRLVAAGVVGACALGVGLGLWARPLPYERTGGPPPPQQVEAPEPPGRRLQIVVDDTPAPIGQPLEVLPDGTAPGRAADLPQQVHPDPEPAAPHRPPVGLMKTVDAEPLPPVVEIKPEPPKIEAAPKPKLEKAIERKVEPKVESKVEARRPEPAKAKAAPPKAKAATAAREEDRARTAQAKVAKKPAAPTARAETAKPRREPAKVAKATPMKPEARKVTAAPPPKARANKTVAPTKTQLARAQAAKAQAQAKADAERKTQRLAAQERVREEKARREKVAVLKASAKASTKPAPPKPAAVRAPPKAKPARPAPQGEGPLRMVRNTCASTDPGEALVCADPRLSVRERQLQRAYRNAEAAGVPASELRRQQARWLAARAAAARDAPWAVEEVYEARIAELNDQSRGSDDRY